MSSPRGKRITLQQAVALGYASYVTLFKAVKLGVIPSEKVSTEKGKPGHGWCYMVSMDDLDALYGKPKDIVTLREALWHDDSASMTLARAIQLGMVPAKRVSPKDSDPFGAVRYEIKAADLDNVYVSLDVIGQSSADDMPMGIKRMLRRMSADKLDSIAEYLNEVRGAKCSAANVENKHKSL